MFIWPSRCVYLLLDKYEEWEGEFSAGTKRHNKIWEAIADDMKKTSIEYTMTGPQCQSKLNGLKKIYKKILDYNSVSGNDRKTAIFSSKYIYIYKVNKYIINFILLNH